MNRDNCKAILANLELIKHFADGGDIGHQAPNCAGEMMPIAIAKGIGLSGLKPDGSTWYLMLKPKYKYNMATQSMDRIYRHWPEVPTADDVMKCKAAEAA